MDPRGLLDLLDSGQRERAEAALATLPAAAPTPDASTAVRFRHALRLLLAGLRGHGVSGDVVARSSPAVGADAEEARLEAAIRAMGAMRAASSALGEGRVGDLVRESRRAAAELVGPMPWMELHVAALLQAAFRFGGDVGVCDEALEACRSVADQVDHPHTAVQGRALMASVHLLRGSYHATASLCDAALALAEATGVADAPEAAMAHQFKGYVLFEWDRLEEARVSLARAWELAGSRRGVGSGVARVSALVAAALGEDAEAESWLGRLAGIVEEPMTLRNREWLTAVRVRHTLGRGDLRGVEERLRAYDYRAYTATGVGDQAVLAHLHELDQALMMLELTGQWPELHALASRVRHAAAGRRAWYEARAATAEAVAREALGKREDAARVWREAMRIGDKGSFVRLYLEGGPVRRGLVERMIAAEGEGGRYGELARALRSAVGPPDAAPLTPKQTEVLALVAQGRSNKAVAQALGVSLSTVKTHLQEAFRRLGARSRTHAVAEARRRGIIGD